MPRKKNYVYLWGKGVNKSIKANLWNNFRNSFEDTQTWLNIVLMLSVQFSSVQFSRSVVSNSLRSHELQHARPPCPSPSPGVHSDSRPLSPRCHPAISSSVVPFSYYPQSLPASESFPMSQLSHEVAKVLELQL